MVGCKNVLLPTALLRGGPAARAAVAASGSITAAATSLSLGQSSLLCSLLACSAAAAATTATARRTRRIAGTGSLAAVAANLDICQGASTGLCRGGSTAAASAIVAGICFRALVAAARAIAASTAAATVGSTARRTGRGTDTRSLAAVATFLQFREVSARSIGGGGATAAAFTFVLTDGKQADLDDAQHGHVNANGQDPEGSHEDKSQENRKEDHVGPLHAKQVALQVFAARTHELQDMVRKGWDTSNRLSQFFFDLALESWVGVDCLKNSRTETAFYSSRAVLACQENQKDT